MASSVVPMAPPSFLLESLISMVDIFTSHFFLLFSFILSQIVLCFIDILGGGFLLGSLVVIIEDPEAPHHHLLLRNFMSQGLVHHQPLFFASPSKDPRMFLGTLPAPLIPSTSSLSTKIDHHPDQEEKVNNRQLLFLINNFDV